MRHIVWVKEKECPAELRIPQSLDQAVSGVIKRGWNIPKLNGGL
jgi:hypothetical protein